MKLAHLTDETLDQETLSLVRSEREILADILHHLRENERRRLFSSYKFGSLFEYATQRLGYSEDQAGRRISAMRLLRDVPSIEPMVASGALTLTHLVKARALFRKEEKANVSRTADEKVAVLAMLENSSMVSAERTLAEESFISQKINPLLAVASESTMEVTESSSQPETYTSQARRIGVHFESNRPLRLADFDENLRAKLQRLAEVRDLPVSDLATLIDQMADLALEKWDPIKKAERSADRHAKKEERSGELQAKKVEQCANHEPNIAEQSCGRAVETLDDAPVPAPARVKAERSRVIPSVVRHAVFFRDQGCCQNCGSRKSVEVDHIVPFAMGGTHELDNLRLLCRSCNQRHAIETLGSVKMSTYLKAATKSYC